MAALSQVDIGKEGSFEIARWDITEKHTYGRGMLFVIPERCVDNGSLKY